MCCVIISIYLPTYLSKVYECDPTSGARVRRLTEPADLFAEAPPKAK